MTDNVKSALRVIEVLKVFAAERTALSQNALIERTCYPQSSMTALLKTLSAHGVLHYNAKSRVYYPTPLVKDLGSWIDDLQPHAPWISDLIRALRQSIGETVALGAQNGPNLMYLRSSESDHAIRYHVRPGEIRPLLESSMGWLLLSRQNSKDIEHVYRRTPLKIRKNVGSLSALNTALEKWRRADHCYLPNIPARAGTVSLFLPISFNGTPTVIGVGGFIDRVEPRKDMILQKMRQLIAQYAQK